ncbi:MAG: glycosyltransferase family 2 protein [Planctomycetales bacterium]|nr:glycosyltransferase family 2 protein [Planctomycetales bacterium]
MSLPASPETFVTTNAAETESTRVATGLPSTSPETSLDASPRTSRAAASTDEAIQLRLHELEQLATELEQLEEDDAADEFAAAPLNLPSDFLLSIVVPVYNERTTIRAIIAKLLALPLPKEIILVDDGSTDGTRDELAALAGLPGLRIQLHDQNRGKGAALRTGFAHVSGTIALVQDADLEYDPRDIPGLLVPILNDEADVVYGSRFLEQRHTGSSSFHQFGNRLLTVASNITTGLKLTDMETCYKVVRASALRDLEIRQNRFGFEPEVTAKLARRGLRFQELPIRYRARTWDAGKKIGWRDAINAFFCIVRYAWVD